MESNNYTTIVFCGGSCKCISFCGAIQYLNEHDMMQDINHVVGVSAGSLIGLFYILGYSPTDIITEINKLNTEYIFGQELNLWTIPSAVYNLISSLGISDGKQLKEHMRILLSKKKIPFSVTFEELFERTGVKFTVSATNLHYKSLESFNYIDTPHVSVIKALQASMCLPFIFQPVNIGGDLYIDGGMQDNLPVSLTENGEKVLAIKLETDENFGSSDYSFIPYISDILDIALSNVWPETHHYSDHVDFVTIHIPYMSILNFNLTNEEIQTLSNAGYDSMCRKFYYHNNNINNLSNKLSNNVIKSKHHRYRKESK